MLTAPQLILTAHLLNFNWQGAGYWSLFAGYWSLFAGYWSLVTAHWLLVAGNWLLVTGKGKVEGRGFNDWGFFRLGISDCGFGIYKKD